MKILSLSAAEVDSLAEASRALVAVEMKARSGCQVDDRERQTRRLDRAVALKQRMDDATAFREVEVGGVLIVGHPPQSLVGLQHVRAALEEVFGEGPLPAAIERAMEAHEAAMHFANLGLQEVTGRAVEVVEAAREAIAETVLFKHADRPEVLRLQAAIDRADMLEGFAR